MPNKLNFPQKGCGVRRKKKDESGKLVASLLDGDDLAKDSGGKISFHSKLAGVFFFVNRLVIWGKFLIEGEGRVTRISFWADGTVANKNWEDSEQIGFRGNWATKGRIQNGLHGKCSWGPGAEGLPTSSLFSLLSLGDFSRLSRRWLFRSVQGISQPCFALRWSCISTTFFLNYCTLATGLKTGSRCWTVSTTLYWLQDCQETTIQIIWTK